MQFEGPEKKLEILFSNNSKSLRQNNDLSWQDILLACGAQIIRKTNFGSFDAYIVSESSLFVFDHKVTLITCGQTDLLRALPLLLKDIGQDQISYLFYCRKSLSFPEAQVSDFEQEVSSILSYISGKSYRLGPANEEHIHVFLATSWELEALPQDDFTLELLMIDPDEEVMSHFCYDHNKPLSEDVRHRMGFSNIYEEEDVKIDDYCFDSCGYSLNGSVNNHYFTLHVTPQEQSSYVSFETSLREDNTFARVQKLLNIFKPSKALLVLYDVSGSSVYNEDSDLWRIEEYTEILSLGYYMKAYQLKKKE